MKKYFCKSLKEDGKLFLCSRDIKLDDKFIHPVYGELTALVIEDGWIQSDFENPNYKTNIDLVYKVIGEISSDALYYVKKGDEFDEDEIAFTIYEPWEEPWQVSHKEWLDSDFHKNIQILGPCGHFH